MDEPFLLALVSLLGGAFLTAATLAWAFVFRRLHELRDRIRDLEAEMEALRPIRKAMDDFGAHALTGSARILFGGVRRAQ